MHLDIFEQPAKERDFFNRLKVAYFYGCFTNTNETDVGKAAVELLEAHGLTVVIPPQRCCGIPRLGVGDLRGRGRWAAGTSSCFARQCGRESTSSSSTSCGLMLRHEYSRILNLPGAEELAGRLFDICEFLLRLHEEEKSAVTFRPLSMKAAYFAPCHLRSLNMGMPGLELLRLIPGLDVRMLEADGCGEGLMSGRKEEVDRRGEGKKGDGGGQPDETRKYS